LRALRLARAAELVEVAVEETTSADAAVPTNWLTVGTSFVGARPRVPMAQRRSRNRAYGPLTARAPQLGENQGTGTSVGRRCAIAAAGRTMLARAW